MMVSALRFDGFNDFCSIATPNSYYQSLTQYRWYCKLIRNNSDTLYIVGRINNFESGIRVSDSSVRVRYGSSSVTFSGLSIPVSTNELEIEVQRDGNTHEIFINNVSQGTASSSATSTTTVNTIGRGYTSYGNMDLILMELYDAPSGGSLISSYNATSSEHRAGTPVLVETVGGNNATGVNMPTDGSAWVNLGGGITVELNFNDITVTPSVDEIALQRFTSLNFNDITVTPSVDLLTLIGDTSLSLNDITVTPSVDEISITRLTNLLVNDVTVAVTVDQLNLQRNMGLLFNDVTVLPSVDLLSLVIGKILQFNDITVTPSVDELPLQRNTNLLVNDVTVEPSVDELNINRYTDLTFNDITVVPSVDLLNLITSYMPDFGFEDIKLSSTTEQYKTTVNTPQYRIGRK